MVLVTMHNDIMLSLVGPLGRLLRFWKIPELYENTSQMHLPYLLVH
jgi:hypothetical protein